MNKQITTWKAISKKERDTGYGDEVENSIKTKKITTKRKTFPISTIIKRNLQLRVKSLPRPYPIDELTA